MGREKVPMTFEEYETRETFIERYQRRIRENPFLSAGLVGLTGMIITGGLKYKKLRAEGMSTSIFLINMRVAAQGMVAGALALGLMAQFFNERLPAPPSNQKQS